MNKECKHTEVSLTITKVYVIPEGWNSFQEKKNANIEKYDNILEYTVYECNECDEVLSED